jgi:hypothetical protein
MLTRYLYLDYSCYNYHRERFICLPEEGVKVRPVIGDSVCHPATERKGQIVDIYENPACLMRLFTIRWEDGEIEEVEELEFGPLED